MRGQSNEIVKTLSRRLIDICCVQESRWRVESARKIAGRNSYNTFFWKGNDPGLVTSMIMLVSMANQHQFQSASWWVWLWNTESGRNENARSLCCYRFSCDKYILQKQKLTTSYIQLRKCATQVDYILFRRTELKLVKNAKVIRYEECIP